MGQIVAMLIQFGFWLTPIFWSIMIYHKWFWEDMTMTLYYWVVTGLLFFLGARTFKKLRPHFSDVL